MPIRTLAVLIVLCVPLLRTSVAADPKDGAASAASTTSAPATSTTSSPAETATATPASSTTATPAAATTATPAASTAAQSTVAAPTSDALQTAVALNYCRASFHRIRRCPTRVVLAQEQEKILNNINLDGIADREVIQLYTSVLDEINQIGLADFERSLAQQYHSTVMQRKFVWDALSIGADVACAHYGDAIRQGVNSWWDYRVMDYNRDSDLLRIEKARLTSVVQKSSQFLDTFWQMTQKKHIPDRWLVRGDDLDALDLAMRERNPEVRLRILKRMESFMEAYPPYWYYVARTQQELGQLFAAMQTYEKVVEIGAGHFRKDDMLATALSNRAAIQDYLEQPSAGETAEKALVYSTDVWEANLICARVLQRSGNFAAAEDAILRNLDVNLEADQSRVFLVVLYEKSDQRDKLLRQLSDPQLIARLPAPVLLRCAARLGQEATPPAVLKTVVESLDGQPRIQFGKDEFVLRASSSWLLNLASLRVYHQGEELTSPEITAGNGQYTIRYPTRFEWGNPLGPASLPSEFELQLTYPDHTEVRLVLAAEPGGSLPAAARVVTSRVTGPTPLRIAQIEVGDARQTESEGLLTTSGSDSAATTSDSALTASDAATEPGARAAESGAVLSDDVMPTVQIPLPPRSDSPASE